MIIEYVKLRDNAHSPQRSHPSDVGLDVFYSPPDTSDPDDSKNDIQLYRLHSALVPTGLRFDIPHGYMLEVKNRSSVASKRSLVVGACVIDPGYDGEVFIDIHNIGRDKQTIRAGDKIAQLVMIPVVHFRPMQIPIEATYGREPIAMSRRGEQGFGSTDDFYGPPKDIQI